MFRWATLIACVCVIGQTITVEAGHRRRRCCTCWTYAQPQNNCMAAPVAPAIATTGAPTPAPMPMGEAPPEAPAPEGAGKSLYERLGGEPAITAVVDDFVGRAAGNPKVNFTRAGTDKEWAATPEAVEKLKKHLVDMVGSATGGPQKYTGRDMKSAHAGMKITNAEFDALAGDLIATLDKFKVPEKEKTELLKIVGSTRADIVEE